jgi:hypothetical protein
MSQLINMKRGSELCRTDVSEAETHSVPYDRRARRIHGAKLTQPAVEEQHSGRCTTAAPDHFVCGPLEINLTSQGACE